MKLETYLNRFCRNEEIRNQVFELRRKSDNLKNLIDKV